jgi:tRNA(Ile)-lysidine synthase
MLLKVKRYIEENRMLEAGDKIVLGVSGGADSLCLFLLFMQLQTEYHLSVFVVHVNHGIRQEAQADGEFVKGLCEKYNVPFFLFEENVPELAKKWKMTEEAAGRKCRYRRFYQVMQEVNANKLATAHHMGDQAETLLFHLIRGSNLAGMAGIRPVSRMDTIMGELPEVEGEKLVIRPLLCVEKTEIEKWLGTCEAVWCQDATNADNRYARNRLRNVVLPELTHINSQAVSHIAGFAECIAGYQAFFQKAVEDYTRQFVELGKNWETGSKHFLQRENCETDRQRLLRQERVLAEGVIYEMLAKVSGQRQNLSREHVEAVYELLDNHSGKQISLPYDMEAKISYEKLVIRKSLKETVAWKPVEIPVEDQRIPLPDGRNLVIKVINMDNLSLEEREKLQTQAINCKNNYTKLFDCDTIKGTLYVRLPEPADYFIMNDKGSKKKLSRYFIDCKIPEEQRKNSMVIAFGHEVIWLVGGRRCENHKVNSSTRRVLSISCEGETKWKNKLR